VILGDAQTMASAAVSGFPVEAIVSAVAEWVW